MGVVDCSFLFLPFCDVASVGSLTSCARVWQTEADELTLWRNFVAHRWRVNPKHQSRVYGASNWKDVYRNFVYERKIPRSRFTKSTNTVFGRGRIPDVAHAWVLVGHRSDCRVIEAPRAAGGGAIAYHNSMLPPGSGGGHNPHGSIEAGAGGGGGRFGASDAAIELRVVVQNTGPRCSALTVEFPKLAATLKVEKMYRSDVKLNTVSCEVISEAPRQPKCVSVNGEVRSSRDSGKAAEGGAVELGPLQFAVYRLFVRCPGCIYESDFLTRAETLDLVIHHQATPSARAQSTTLRAQFCEENVVWDNYELLPGGFMMLTDVAHKRF